MSAIVDLASGPVAVELVGPHGYIHGWIFVGADVTHKDGSKGVVKKYDPNTQTAHVDWHSGVRQGKASKTTTKAYHLVKPGAATPAEPRFPTVGAGKVNQTVSAADRKAVHAAKLPPDQQMHYLDLRVSGKSHQEALKQVAPKAATAHVEKAKVKAPKTPVTKESDQESVHRVLAQVRTEGPTRSPGLKAITANKLRGTRVNGQYFPGSGLIAVNPDIIHGARASATGTMGGHFTPREHAQSKLHSTLTHEFGHHIDFSMSPAQRQAMHAEVAKSLGIRNSSVTTPFTAEEKSAIINKVGIYASANRRELIAELYAESKLASHPRPAAQIVGKHVKAAFG
jgi:hypothetical protein